MKKITIALLALFSNLIFAQDGVLDTTFGTNGYYMIGGSEPAAYHQLVDGKILYRSGNKIYRLTTNGIIDTTFGVNGSITMTQPGTNARYGFLVNNNKICAFSRNTSGLSNYIYFMGRYNMDGTPDTTLGAGTGSITLEQSYFVGGLATTTDAAGNLIVGSTTYGGNNVDSDVVARRYSADGVFQQSEFWGLQFGYNMSSSSIGLETWDGMRGVNVAPNGNVIFTVGMTYYGTPSPPEGYRSGYVTMRPGVSTPSSTINSYQAYYDSAKSSIAIDADSNVYMLTGSTLWYNNVPQIVNIVYKRNALGNLYNAFGTNGALSPALNVGGFPVNFTNLAVQPDGKLLLAGATTNATNVQFSAYMVLARFLPDGTLDTTFGTNGYVQHDIAHPTTFASNYSTDIILSPDGTDIYLAGYNPENSIFLKYSNPSLEPLAVPTFDAIASICAGDTAPVLSSVSTNGISGTWSPATISNTASAVYTFTPDADEHATTATLSVTVNQPTTATVTQSACENYTWSANGMVYTESGAYTHVTTNAAGCSLTTTLNLTINHDTTASVSATACDSYTWSANGAVYSDSGSYNYVTTNAAGCTQTTTLNLTVNHSTTESVSASACESYTWAVNGNTYTDSGNYAFATTNPSGCTHTATLNLTINNAVAPTGTSGQTFEEGATLSNIAITPSTVVWYASEADALVPQNPLSASTVLTDATTYYAVNTTAQGCTSDPFAVTVSVTLGTDTFDTAHFSLYPNPTAGLVNLKYSAAIDTVSIHNVLGQQVISKAIGANEASIDVSALTAGTYFVKVTSGKAMKTIKLLKN